MPVLSLAMMVLTLGSIGLPGTMGFWGEFITLMATFKTAPYVAGCAAVGMVLGAAYMLRLYRVCFWGESSSPAPAWAPITHQEKLTLGVLCFLVVLWGVYPKSLTQAIQQASHHALHQHAR